MAKVMIKGQGHKHFFAGGAPDLKMFYQQFVSNELDC